MMPADELAAIRARVADATPGPWIKWFEDGSFSLAPEARCLSDPPWDWPAAEDWRKWQQEMDEAPQPILDHEGCSVWPWVREADMCFAYAARTDIPTLLAAHDALVAENARLRAGIAGLRREHTAIPASNGGHTWSSCATVWGGEECTCGAQEHNAKVDALLKGDT